MTAPGDERDLERTLSAWLQPGPVDISAEAFDLIMATVTETRQRRPRRWLAPGRPRVDGLERHAGMLTAAALVAIVGAWLVVGNRMPVPANPAAGPAASAETPVVLELVIRDVAFEPTELYPPADRGFSIRVTDEDDGIPHGLDILDPSGALVFTGAIVEGPGVHVYDVPSLRVASYVFQDPVHPMMAGTLHVGEPAPAGTPEAVAPTPPPPDVVITTDGQAFSPSVVAFTGGRRFWIELRSTDPTTDHGIAIDDELGNPILRLGIRTRDSTRYPVDAVPDGRYVIYDPEHPTLRSTLVVGGG
jgi:hypothetical protein